MNKTGQESGNQECRLHSMINCRFCLYDGTYSLDIENPFHQEVISNFLEKSRRKNNREQIYERRKKHFVERLRMQTQDNNNSTPSEEVVVISSDEDDVRIRGSHNTAPTHDYNLSDQRSVNCLDIPANSLSLRENRDSPSGTSLTSQQFGIFSSVNYASARHNDVDCLPVPISAEFAVTASQPTSSRSITSGVAPNTSAVNRPSITGSTSGPSSSQTVPINRPLHGTGITEYSAQWLSLPSTSTLSSRVPGSSLVIEKSPLSQRGESVLMDFPNDGSTLSTPWTAMSTTGTAHPSISANSLRSTAPNNSFANHPSKSKSPEVVETPLARRLSRLTSKRNVDISSTKTQLPSNAVRTQGQSAAPSISTRCAPDMMPSMMQPPCVSRGSSNQSPPTPHALVMDHNYSVPLRQPLPPVESSMWGVRNWQETTPQALLLSENQTVSREAVIQSIVEWLVASSMEYLHPIPMLPSRQQPPPSTAQTSPPVSWGSTNSIRNRAASAARGNRRGKFLNSETPSKTLPQVRRPAVVQGRIRKPNPRRNKKNYNFFVIVCESEAFIVRTCHLEMASPILKEALKRCCVWIFHNGEAFRGLNVEGIPPWAMKELLNFMSGHSYNHYLMRSSHMKRWLDMLGIKYQQKENFVFRV